MTIGRLTCRTGEPLRTGPARQGDAGVTSNRYFNDRVSYDNEYDPRFAPRFAEIATFLRAPHRLDLTGLDIGIAGVPFDGGAPIASAPVTGRARCATSPR